MQLCVLFRMNSGITYGSLALNGSVGPQHKHHQYVKYAEKSLIFDNIASIAFVYSTHSTKVKSKNNLLEHMGIMG